MKRNIATGMLLLIFGLGLLSTGAYAQNGKGAVDIEAKKQAIEEKTQQRLERLEAKNARRCEQVKTKLEAQRDKGLEIREHRKKRYLHIVDRLNSLAVRLENDDLDSTALRASIQQLTDLINTYAASSTEFESEIQAAINSSCAETGVVKDNVKAAREKLVVLKSNADDIHIFFQEQLKPLLQSIKEQVKQLRQSAETEGDDAGDPADVPEQQTGNSESTNEE